ncbi:laccase-7-like [Quercus suber]|uniref:laccase-7-like n=1 Tax=Quercus suber TaxID=58331 RepID=UPI0032DE4C5B
MGVMRDRDGLWLEAWRDGGDDTIEETTRSRGDAIDAVDDTCDGAMRRRWRIDLVDDVRWRDRGDDEVRWRDSWVSPTVRLVGSWFEGRRRWALGLERRFVLSLGASYSFPLHLSALFSLMMMGRFQFLLACALALLSSSLTSAETVEHFFHVQNLTVQRLCHEQVITTVNGTLPGPVISVREGDDLVIHVVNQSPYNITIHWHGVFQLLSAWADGPSYVTQCPIHPGQTYAYRFKITGQEGTLWWHAHVSWLRATVYGALIIKPRFGNFYPFPSPYEEFPILLGEYWDANVVDVENQGLATGAAPNISDAFTINGQPGDLYPCSQTANSGNTTTGDNNNNNNNAKSGDNNTNSGNNNNNNNSHS